MAVSNKAKVEAHLKRNQYAQMVMKAMEAGESDEKISKRLTDANNRIMKYGAINEQEGKISSRFVPKEATPEQIQELRDIEVARKLHSVAGHSEEWTYKELNNAIDGVLADGTTPTTSKQIARISAAAQKDDPKKKAPWNSVTIRMS